MAKLSFPLWTLTALTALCSQQTFTIVGAFQSNPRVSVASCVDKRSHQLFRSPSPVRPRTTTSRNAFSTDASAIFADVDAFYQNYPYFAAFLTCGAKSSLADFLMQRRTMAQEAEELSSLLSEDDEPSAFDLANDDDDDDGGVTTALLLEEDADPFVVVEDRTTSSIDYAQNFALILYGGVGVGLYSEFIYNHVYPVLFGTGTSLEIVCLKVAFDNLVFAPVLCIPLAYLAKAVVKGGSLSDGFDRYVDDVRNHGLLNKYWMLWFPAQFVTFGLIPPRWRIVFVTAVSFVWALILAAVSGRKVAELDALLDDPDECVLDLDAMSCMSDGSSLSSSSSSKRDAMDG